MNDKFNVLRPVYIKTDQIVPNSNPQFPTYYWRVEWMRAGKAHSMADAKQKFGGSPVLEAIEK